MKILFQTYIILLLATNPVFPQFLFQGELGSFASASSFSYNPAGFFFITDAYTNELIKIDSSGNRLTDIGGYGWQGGSFDNPIDVYATTLNVYVADKNNNRIQIFDKDLNFITSFSNEGEQDETFGYPLSCCVSPNGELFILDGENKKIIRFDQNGRFLLQFGRFDSGEFVLSDPITLTITQDSKLVVLDDTDLVFYDQFGTGITRISVKNQIRNINVTFDKMVLTSDQKVFSSDLSSASPRIDELILPESDWDNFVEGILIGDKLYLLTSKNILVFKKEKG